MDNVRIYADFKVEDVGTLSAPSQMPYVSVDNTSVGKIHRILTWNNQPLTSPVPPPVITKPMPAPPVIAPPVIAKPMPAPPVTAAPVIPV